MDASKINDYARQLKEAHGEAAVTEAARKAVELEKIGDEDGARTWRKVETALIEMGGPHES